ncbi:hypothetical protein BKN38_02625 [Helicobacter sp. CLO-3]|uniref:hypothetical protein n=1 Tax=unclassified Helicobacter TaxID=2593540 RepID=UPI000805942A|nr:MULTISPECIES: hypothetical protein [unclassified Helicobacter]OBV28386.1 hypothetical protein BA723_09550 [Helicobacter sp. CLO-3]OHU84695.1 hypothetical protein BKN38_02625 [Helicobacter sp. CLO-3]
MSKIDAKKETISFLKFWRNIITATIFAIAGWCAFNYGEVTMWLIVASCIIMIILAFVALRLSKVISKHIDELGDL